MYIFLDRNISNYPRQEKSRVSRRAQNIESKVALVTNYVAGMTRFSLKKQTRGSRDS